MNKLRKLLAKSATRRVITGLICVSAASAGVMIGEETVSVILLAITTLWLGAEGDEFDIEDDDNQVGA